MFYGPEPPQKPMDKMSYLYYLVEEILEQNINIAYLSSPPELNVDPTYLPKYWVSTLLDFRQRYGIAYQLSDGLRTGVLFNDDTQLVLMADAINIRYIDKQRNEYNMTNSVYKNGIDNKLNKFRQTCARLVFRPDRLEPDDDSAHVTRIQRLLTCIDTKKGHVLHFNNGLYQIVFFDSSKIVLCPYKKSVTYISANNQFCTYRFSTILNGELYSNFYGKLTFARDQMRHVMTIEELSEYARSETVATAY